MASKKPDTLARRSRLGLKLMRGLPAALRAFKYAAEWTPPPVTAPDRAQNPFRTYFDSHHEGPGIWKWIHYFDAYHRHFARFIGRPVNVLEIGIYSGGSLGMLRDYFGPHCTIYGVDIEPACKTYENDWTKVYIGDQADRAFWRRFRQEVPSIDIVIDDGGHEYEQQAVTLEEMLPHVRPGGVYLCEDICGALNEFNAYVYGLISHLNTCNWDSSKPHASSVPTAFQSVVHSIHCYPWVTVIEKFETPVDELLAPKHGTEWQPFL